MEIVKGLDAFAGAGGLLLGATYILGGWIVRLHLSRYNVTDYQILRVKYLVVGAVYLLNFGAVLLLASVPAVAVAMTNSLVQQSFLFVSVVTSIAMLWLWGRPNPERFRLLLTWPFWVLFSALSAIYPLVAVLRLVIGSSPVVEAIVLGIQLFLTSTLSVVSQTYFYSRHLYGRPTNPLGVIDPVGMGIPVTVTLAIHADAAPALKALKLPFSDTAVVEGCN